MPAVSDKALQQLLKDFRERMQKEGNLLTSDPEYIPGYDKVVERVAEKEVFFALACYLSIKILLFVFAVVAAVFTPLLIVANGLFLPLIKVRSLPIYWPTIAAVFLSFLIAWLCRSAGRHRCYEMVRLILQESKELLKDWQ